MQKDWLFFSGRWDVSLQQGPCPFCSRQTSQVIETKDPTSWCGLMWDVSIFVFLRKYLWMNILNTRKTHQIIYIATGCKHPWKVLKLVRTKCASGSIQYHRDSSKDGLNEGIHIYSFHNLSSLILCHRLHPKCVAPIKEAASTGPSYIVLANSRSPSSIKFEPSDSSVIATGFSWKYHVCHLSRLECHWRYVLCIYIYTTYICMYICLAHNLSIVAIGMTIHCVRNGEK